MNNSIHKTADIFIKKQLKNKVNFETISEYLRKTGFTVCLYTSSKDNDLLINYNLLELSKTVKGFTVYKRNFKAVFIDDDVSCEEKLCVLMHETAHILLSHVDKKQIQESRAIEMEADALAYEILNHKKSYMPQFIIATVLLVAIIATTVSLTLLKRIEHTPYTPVSADILTEQTKEISQSVLVTPSGTKFHRSDCRYTKDKDCTTLIRSEALKDYAPCSVCKP